MNRLLLTIAIIFTAASLQAATCIVTVDWDGLQVNAQPERSLPCRLVIQDFDTGDTYTQADIPGPVSGFALPPFSLVAPDNTEDLVVRITAKITDSVGNPSALSAPVTVTVPSKDTLAPGTVLINITVQQ